MKWQFPVLSAGCAEGVPPPTGEPGSQHSLPLLGGTDGCETWVHHWVQKTRV